MPVFPLPAIATICVYQTSLQDLPTWEYMSCIKIITVGRGSKQKSWKGALHAIWGKLVFLRGQIKFR